ncbi:hypothetical protein LP414_30560 [Polaromonas sp. P1(28)-13]|nr:hypothetical protein LP417_29580 [Polaromonas sp. P1-6]UUZ70633.1 hypothetical protein LP416_28230 [Polaromonas sp. P2-4]UUZ78648.1 hypothetical protein LP414_30560 [Polaromonas sp. P1(28)-13]
MRKTGRAAHLLTESGLDGVAKLVKAYHSEEIRKFVQTEFKGSVLAGFYWAFLNG